jgi:hypothetical protein
MALSETVLNLYNDTTQADLVGYIRMVSASHPLSNGTLQIINNTLEYTRKFV